MFEQRPTEEAATAPYWSVPHDQLLAQLKVAADGLSAAEAARRLAIGRVTLIDKMKKHGLRTA